MLRDWIKIAANHKLSGKFNLLELLEDQSSYTVFHSFINWLVWGIKKLYDIFFATLFIYLYTITAYNQKKPGILQTVELKHIFFLSKLPKQFCK